MSVYVFRINYEDCYDFIKSEILSGRLRQGWGCEGTDLLSTDIEGFKNAGKTTGQWNESDDWFIRRHNILWIMCEMRTGDIVVVPKLNMRETGFHSDYFTVFKVTDEYRFETISVPVWDNFKEFGHIIGVEIAGSFSYSRDEFTRIISAKFKGYQRPVNRVYSEVFINALEELMSRAKRNPDYAEGEDKLTLEALASSVSSARKEVLKKILDTVNNWQPGHFEDAVTQLFVNNGFLFDRRHVYNKEGGDIDISFTVRPSYSLMGDIALCASELFPVSEVRVQTKKKIGLDANDIDGVHQLLKSEGYDKAVNIVINTAEKFNEETREYAAMNGIILISGFEFADMLLKYGLVFTD